MVKMDFWMSFFFFVSILPFFLLFVKLTVLNWIIWIFALKITIFFHFTEDEEEEDGLLNDAYEGMKLRSKSRHGSGEENGSIARKADEEDPLKWIEENIPESENPLPIIDSDEEIETTKLEINKMQ